MIKLTLIVALVASLIATSQASASSIYPSTLRAPSVTENHIAWAVHNLINKERSAHDRAPLKMNNHLRLSARRHDRRMARYDTLTHQFSWEPYFGQREINAGYHWTYAGENIAFNTDMTKAGALLLERLMYHEQAPYNDHRLNILSPHYRAVGVDVWFDSKHHTLWLTTDFGRH
jgi:uncharacterized protein YkwD